MDAFEAISPPTPSDASIKKYFTLDEANRSLVLVRRIVRDVVRNYRRLRELHEACQSLDRKGDLAAAERTRQEYATITDRFAELREELEDIGCELRDFEIGWVNFPAVRAGREIFFCWKPGEDRVRHWQEAGKRATVRHILDEPSV